MCARVMIGIKVCLKDQIQQRKTTANDLARGVSVPLTCLDLPGGFGKRRTHALYRWWVVKQFVVVVGAALAALFVGAVWWLKLEPGPPTVEF